MNIGFSDWENLWTWATIAKKSVFVYWCWAITNQSRYSIPKSRLLSVTIYIYIVWHIKVKAFLHVSYPFLLYTLTKVNNIIVVIDSVPFRSPYEVNLSRCCKVRLQVKLGWKSDSNTKGVIMFLTLATTPKVPLQGTVSKSVKACCEYPLRSVVLVAALATA